MKRDLRRTAVEVAGTLSSIADYLEDGEPQTPRGRLVARSLDLQASILRSAVRIASAAPASADVSQEAGTRARAAIEAIRSRGETPTVRAVAAEARCGWSAARRALQAWRGGGNTPNAPEP